MKTIYPKGLARFMLQSRREDIANRIRAGEQPDTVRDCVNTGARVVINAYRHMQAGLCAQVIAAVDSMYSSDKRP